jgi:hypothetical protein
LASFSLCLSLSSLFLSLLLPPLFVVLFVIWRTVHGREFLDLMRSLEWLCWACWPPEGPRSKPTNLQQRMFICHQGMCAGVDCCVDCYVEHLDLMMRTAMKIHCLQLQQVEALRMVPYAPIADRGTLKYHACNWTDIYHHRLLAAGSKKSVFWLTR